MNVAVCVPRRSDGGRRDELWEFCRPWWDRLGWPVFEGGSPSGPFNRSAAINSAAELAGDRDVYVIADSDVVINPGQVTLAIEIAAETECLVFPYTEYRALNQQMSARVLDGFDGNWTPGTELRMARHVSSVLAVPAALWKQVRGFDERFIGWGWDDVAFHYACATTKGATRVEGTVWHLWHPTAPENTVGEQTYRSTPDYLANRALTHRYSHATEAQMAALLAEDRGSDQIVAVVLTVGDRDTLAPTIESFEANVKGPIGRRILVVDGPTCPTFPGWEKIHIRARSFTRAMQAASRIATESGQPWVFWSEDDFTYDTVVDLEAMQAEMDTHPDLTQMALLRRPWFPKELEAGGVLDVFDPATIERRANHLAHRNYWTTNPHLVRRTFLAANKWPNVKWSEAAFGRQVFADPAAKAGVWGDGTPHTTHIGDTRTGRGY